MNRSRWLMVVIVTLTVVGVFQPVQSLRAAGDIHQIKHVIVIMQENRSFDQYFGTYPGADGIPMKDGAPTVCVTDPKTQVCVKPYHDTRDVTAGCPHGQAAATGDINGGKMDGFIAAFRAAQKACKNPDTPGCANGETPDVMGYKDGTDIPNYWAYAKKFVLQDRMFEPNASWSLPSHLFMVSGWSARCPKAGDPMSCINDIKGPSGVNVAKNDYAWTDLTYLLYKNNISWAYYLSEGDEPDCEDDAMMCQPKTQSQKVPGIWNPLPAFDTVRNDGQLANIQTLDKFFDAVKGDNLPAVSWIVPENKVSEHPPAKVSVGQAYVTGIDAYLKFIEDDFLGGQRLDPKTDGRPDPRPTVRENVPQLGDLVNDFDFTQEPHKPFILPIH